MEDKYMEAYMQFYLNGKDNIAYYSFTSGQQRKNKYSVFIHETIDILTSIFWLQGIVHCMIFTN